MKSVLLALALLICAAAAESIRETETMDPNGWFDDDIMESSGSLPDDEDLDDYGGLDLEDDLDSDDLDSADEEGSGSGDEMDDLESTLDTPTTTMGNRIPEDYSKGLKNDIDVLQTENDIIIQKNLMPNGADQSNEISMPITNNSFLSKTEVVVALVAGACVGLLFAIFIIVLLVMRIRRNKGDLTYDPVKKPIYKKAPTVDA